MNYSDWTIKTELDIYSNLQTINCALELSPNVVIVIYYSHLIVAEAINNSSSLASIPITQTLVGE